MTNQGLAIKPPAYWRRAAAAGERSRASELCCGGGAPPSSRWILSLSTRQESVLGPHGRGFGDCPHRIFFRSFRQKRIHLQYVAGPVRSLHFSVCCFVAISRKKLVLFYGECPFMYYIIIMYILVVIVYFFLLLLYYSICVGNLVLAKSEHGENGRL